MLYGISEKIPTLKENGASNLYFKPENGIIGRMIVKAIRKKRDKCFSALLCLLVAVNSVHGAVLCFGTDGHVQIETTFHEQCNDPVHYQDTEQKLPSYQVNHEEDEHCQPCVDIPISIGLIKITRTPKQLHSAFSVPAANFISPTEQFNLSAHNPASNTFDAAGYFVPLSTVVLLI